MGLKARVKATGEIISIDEKSTVLDTNPCNFNSYEISELEILYENTNFPQDYWKKLLHQYAGMFVKSFLDQYDGSVGTEDIINSAIKLAHALVERYKKEEK